MSSKKNPFEGSPFEWINIDINDFKGSYDFNNDFADASRYAYGAQQQGPSQHQQPIYDQCIKDAIEYFEPLGVKVATEHTRRRFTEPLKKRVVEFLKHRKKHYEENGLLITNE